MKFHDQLDALTDRWASMYHPAGQAIEAATDALGRVDLPAAERVFDLNEQIEALRGPCEEQAMRLLLAGPGGAGSTAGHHRGAPGDGPEPDWTTTPRLVCDAHGR